LHIWLDNHPFKTNPEAPLWIDLGKTAKGPVPLDYSGFRAVILRTVERHNKRAEKLGIPKITKRIHTHLFRYHAQTRDELDGVPRSIMCKQRGWKTDSRCKEVNASGMGYCYKCGLPLSIKAENVEQQLQSMIEEMLMDPEIHAKLRDRLAAKSGLEMKT
jgi:hypothetical protein